MADSRTATGTPVFVTGATSGIGLETSRHLARRGFRVFGGVLPGEDPAPLDPAGVVPIAIDVTDERSIAAAREEVAKQLREEPLAGLVNCAGVLGAVGPVESLDIEATRRAFDVNVIGVLAVTKAFVADLRAARGRVVNMSSLSGIVALPFLVPYCATKWAVEAVSDSLRRELGPFGVGVVVVQPGVVRTPLWNAAQHIDLEPYRGGPYDRAVRRLHTKSLRRAERGQDPAEVAAAIHLALSAEKPPSRIRVQRKWSSRLRYGLVPLLPDRLVDRMVVSRIWKERPGA